MKRIAETAVKRRPWLPAGLPRFTKSPPAGGHDRRIRRGQRPGLPLLSLLFGSICLACLAAGCSRAPAAARELVFVAAERDNSISVVDLERMAAVARIPVSRAPVAVRACPVRNEIYAVTRGGRLEVIDAEDLSSIASIAVAGSPVLLEVTGDGNTAFVLSRVQPFVHVVDLRARRVVRSIPLPAGTEPAAVRLAPGGNHLYVADAAGHRVITVDLGRRGVAAYVLLPGAPSDLAVLPDNSLLYAAVPAAGQVSVVDLNLMKLMVHLPIGDRPSGLALKPDGGELLASSAGSNAVAIINSYGAEIALTVPVGANPVSMVVTRDSSRAYVANAGSDSITVLDIDNRRVVAAVPAGNEPARMALTGDERFLLVLNARSNDMAVIRAQSNPPSLFTMIPVGLGPAGLAVKSLARKR